MKMTKVALLSLIMSSPIYANWSDYTFLGTLNNVVFSYRTYEPADSSEGSQVQFRVTNLNSIRSRIRIDDKAFHCFDGSIENPNRTTDRIKAGETTTFDPIVGVCKNSGGLNYINVTIDALVRR